MKLINEKISSLGEIRKKINEIITETNKLMEAFNGKEKSGKIKSSKYRKNKITD